MTNLTKVKAPWLILGVVAVIALGLLMPACGGDRERAGAERENGETAQERREGGAPATDETPATDEEQARRGQQANGQQVTTIDLPAFLSNPDEYYDRRVAVSGVVRQAIAPGAFVLAPSQGAPQNQSVLVFGSNIGTVTPGSQVRVVGTAKKFDFDDMNREVAMNWNEAAFRAYDGKPAIHAMQVTAGQGAREQGAGAYGGTGTQAGQRTR